MQNLFYPQHDNSGWHDDKYTQECMSFRIPHSYGGRHSVHGFSAGCQKKEEKKDDETERQATRDAPGRMRAAAIAEREPRR
ncbi:hypothetical protein [uncultured Desulfovibrio sp.]|uniref:hypothetical protein n=1 Tax=uncultured Desulfovibrio sp. TaxID=167968 RepID=UPI0026231505|nr:hypothetical protein [uncultured Desulfovibrio sp.]